MMWPRLSKVYSEVLGCTERGPGQDDEHSRTNFYQGFIVGARPDTDYREERSAVAVRWPTSTRR